MKSLVRSLVRRAACACRPRTLVLAYHHVREPGRTTPGVTTPPASFAAHMEYLVRRRLVVSMDRLLADLRDRGRPTGGRVVVTFDDAVSDTWDTAYPILRDLGAPATVFVPTGLVGGRRPFWWNRLFLLSEAAKAKGVDLAPLFAGRGAGPADAPPDRWDAVRWLDEPRREAALERAAELLGLDDLDDGPTPMSRDQLAAMGRDNLVTLGAHTVSHPVLAGLTDGELAAEIVASRDALTPFPSFRPVFAYPYGDADAYDARVQRAIRDAGFEAAFTTDSRSVSGAEDRTALGRVCVDDAGIDEFRWLVDHHLLR